MPEQKDRRYVVQILVVKEVEVFEIDDIQAEVAAFRKLKDTERDAACLSRVLNDGEDGNDVWDDTRKAIGKFYVPDMDWINSSM